MSAMTFSTEPGMGDPTAVVAKLRAKFGPIAAVVAIHAVLFYLISSGLLHRMVDVAIPHAVMVTFVAPPPPPKPAAPAAPKTVSIAKVRPPPQVIVPPTPVVQVAVQNTITASPPSAPAVSEAPAAPVAVAAPPAPPAPGPKTITSGVEYIQPPQPVYPTMSKRMGEQGKVVLLILVNEKGMPDQVKVQTSSGSARLDEAGRQAALRAVFKPHVEDGHPVSVYVIVPLTFQLAS
ncbi:energy transducer TonB [Massilia pseudoviolaceinigra]|uniref:energy transducer TonB n=1 Tax=Massilia pseudoviolaceinigra TaxID=3057165 RepID=UPI002796421B|nr:energy transducer TonB [Massilia sp. CCM 9206]MDQ1922703.1 energy transducer TonB [Massilia sp. CCM 9206]